MGPIAEPAHSQVEIAYLGDALIPFRGAGAFEAERLHRADAVDALDQGRALVRFRLDQLVRHPCERPEEGRDDERDAAGGNQHGPGECRLHVEQHGQQQQNHRDVDECRRHPSGEELAYAVELGNLIGELARLVALEEVDRQRHQAVENRKIQPGIKAAGQNDEQHPSRPGNQHFEAERDQQDGDDQRKRVHALIHDHSIQRGHDHQHGQYAQDGDGDRADRDIAQDRFLAPDQAGEHPEIEGLLVLAAVARGARQHRGAVPNLLEAEFVHGNRVGAERARIAHQYHPVLAIPADHQGRATIAEQEQDRRRAFDLHQLMEGEARAARPEARLAEPFHQHARGGRNLRGIEPDGARRDRRRDSGRRSSPRPGAHAAGLCPGRWWRR